MACADVPADIDIASSASVALVPRGKYPPRRHRAAGRLMIVRPRPSGWRLFFVARGSIVPKVAPAILATVLIAVAVTYLEKRVLPHPFTVSAAPFTIVGLALSIFLGFRNSTAYDRYWEGRRLWGELLISSRALARQVASLLSSRSDSSDQALAGLQRRMTYKIIAFAHALRHHLRGTDAADELAPLLSDDEWQIVRTSRNAPNAVLRSLGRDLCECLAQRRIGDPLAARIDATLDSLGNVLGGCERIRNTPIPFVYTLLLHRTAYLYCFLLPWGLVDTAGLATPVVVGLVSYTFFGLDAVGDEIEEPFGMAPNDLPLSSLCRTIEIDLREALGEQNLPAPLLPEDYCLQ